MRIPTRLMWTIPPRGPVRVSAQITPYSSPGGAVDGTEITTAALRRPPEGTSEELGSTDVHVESGSPLCPTAPRNTPFFTEAAAAYRVMDAVEGVALGTWRLRWITAPGATSATM